MKKVSGLAFQRQKTLLIFIITVLHTQTLVVPRQVPVQYRYLVKNNKILDADGR